MSKLKHIILFCSLVFAIGCNIQARVLSHIFTQDINVVLKPQSAGKLSFQDLTDSVSYLTDTTVKILVSVDYFAGWMPTDTETVYSAHGIPEKVIFHASAMDQSIFADSLLISELFFCPENQDTLTDWFEIVNVSQSEIVLKGAFIQTSEGKMYFKDSLLFPAKSCVVFMGNEGFNLNMSIDSLVFADNTGAIISKFSWDASRLNFPIDTLFSLEIKDVYAGVEDISNWDIIYGKGRAGLLPFKYAEETKSLSVWIWLKFVVWAFAAIILIMIIAVFLKKNNSPTEN